MFLKNILRLLKTTTFRCWLNVIIKSKKYLLVSVYIYQNNNGWKKAIPLEKSISNYTKSLARSESAWIFRWGFRFLMNNIISKTKQPNFPWQFLKTLNWFSVKRWLLLWASTKCRPITEYLCSAKRWTG